MRLTPELAGKLNLKAAARVAVEQSMDRLPRLIANASLSNALPELAEDAKATFLAGHSVVNETLTMPRRGFGPRPVNVLSPQSRTLYNALVSTLESLLPEPSRAPGRWEAFKRIENDIRSDHYLVEFDITACYEYIDHRVLSDELVLQTANADESKAIIDFLADVYPMGRGLPQMHNESDRLADTYLEGIERQLVRLGFDVARYADDFRYVAKTWGEANDLLEHAADCARKFGLVLSGEKTGIRRLSTVSRQQKDVLDAFKEYFDSAVEELTVINVVTGGSHYDDLAVEVEEPAEAEAQAEAFRKMLRAWTDKAAGRSGRLLEERIPTALRAVASHESRIEDDILSAIVVRVPLRLQNVIDYMMEREHESEENWETLACLVGLQRQSPWAKLWLLDCAAGLTLMHGQEIPEQVVGWAAEQLRDRHEVVRAQAAWFMAKRGSLTEENLRVVALSATALTMPAVAACAGAADLDPSRVKMLANGGRISKRAHEWGKSQVGE